MNNMIIFYPELFFKKNLADVFNIEMKKINSELKVDLFDSKNQLHYARYEKYGKFCQIFIAKYKRTFSVDYWKQGVCLAHSSIGNKRNVALSINEWIINNNNIKEFTEKYPFVIFNDIAEDFENNNEVDYSWKKYLKEIPKSHPELKDFVFESYKNNKIKKLFPYMSLNNFCFSRCTGYPYTTDCPYVYVENGIIIIKNRKGKILGKGNVEESIKIILDNIPDDFSFAVKGIADELDK